MRPDTVPRLAAEFLGTLFLVYFGAGAATHAAGGLVGVALAHAFALALAVWIFGSVSGAHVNPAVSIALALKGRLVWMDAALYIAAQLVGAVVAALLLWATFGDGGAEAGLGATHVGSGFPVVGALIAEIIGTFLLVSAVYNLAVRERVPVGFAGLGIGLALAAVILAVGPVSGASLNPARTFGPELVLSIAGDPDWSKFWIYLVGPIVGAVLAVYAHDFFTPTTKPPATVRKGQ
jgi:glycerol uptake facilitator protein